MARRPLDNYAAEPAIKKMRMHSTEEPRYPADPFHRASRFPPVSHPEHDFVQSEHQRYSGSSTFQRSYPQRDGYVPTYHQETRHPNGTSPSILHTQSHSQMRHANIGLPGMSSLLHVSGSPQHPRRTLDGGTRSAPIHPDLNATTSWMSAGSPPGTSSGSRYSHNHEPSFYQRYAGGGPPPPPASAPLRSSSVTTTPLKRSPQSSGASTSEDDDAASVTTAKSSRYLREMDRRAILDRLANGEKQATLAKEYQVSRAAICNLNKHRDEVMSRADENPFAKHPKKRKLRTVKASSSPTASTQTEPLVPTVVTPCESVQSMGDASSSPSPLATVHVVKSRAVQLLLTTLRDPATSTPEFRRGNERLMRLVLEDALALVACKPVEVVLNDQVTMEGIARRHPPCAVSLEQTHCPMMDLFHVLEPDHPTGYARLPSAGGGERVHLLAAHLPATLRFYNVFLLDLVASGGESVCESIQQLIQRGAVEERIHLVALFVSSEVVAMVQCKFPRVQLVTTAIDASLNRSSGSGRGGSSLDGVVRRLHHLYARKEEQQEAHPELLD